MVELVGGNPPHGTLVSWITCAESVAKQNEFADYGKILVPCQHKTYVIAPFHAPETEGPTWKGKILQRGPVGCNPNC